MNLCTVHAWLSLHRDDLGKCDTLALVRPFVAFEKHANELSWAGLFPQVFTGIADYVCCWSVYCHSYRFLPDAFNACWAMELSHLSSLLSIRQRVGARKTTVELSR